MMALGKIQRKRYKLKNEIILCQASKLDITEYEEGATHRRIRA
jgi:hypothetical protein